MTQAVGLTPNSAFDNPGSDPAITFVRRPSAVPGDLRPEWRLPLILMVVRYCRAQQASKEQVHILVSAILSEGSRRALAASLAGRFLPQLPLVQYEPALDRGIDRCLGLGLLTLTSAGRLALTDKAQVVLGAVDGNRLLFARERELLASLPKHLSQTALRAALKRRVDA